MHSRVALSNIYAYQKLGANVRVCGPPTLIPKNMSDLGVQVSFDLKDSLRWCDVVNVLRIQLERQDLKFFPSLRTRRFTSLFLACEARKIRLGTAIKSTTAPYLAGPS